MFTAAALTAGLAAYFIRLGQLGLLNDEQGNPVDRTPLGIKNHIINSARTRFSTPRKGIYNGIDTSQSFCRWRGADLQQRLRRQQDSEQCAVPSSVTSPPKTSTTATSTSISTSSSASTSTSASSISFPSDAALERNCHNETDFEGHANIKKSLVVDYAAHACRRWTGYPSPGFEDARLGPNSAKVDHTYRPSGVSYKYSVEWSEGCELAGDSKQSIYAPVGSDDYDDTCQGLWVAAYEGCKWFFPRASY